MKTKTLIAGSLSALALLFVSSGNLAAQNDTTYIKREAPDTVKVIEKTTVVHDTVVAPQRVAEQPKEEEVPLRWGEFGLRFFPTVTYLSFNTAAGDVVKGEATLNYGYGAMLGFNFTRHFGIMAEADYLGIEQKYKDQALDRVVHLNYINVPVMLQFNTDKKAPVNLNLVAGPQFGINVGSDVSASGDENAGTVQATVAAKGGDVGIAYGAGLEIALNHQHTFRIDLGFRGMYGLVDISSDEVAPNTYNVLVHASRSAYGGYIGIALAW